MQEHKILYLHLNKLSDGPNNPKSNVILDNAVSSELGHFRSHLSVSPSNTTKVLILPAIGFLAFCMKLGSMKCGKVTKRDFQKKVGAQFGQGVKMGQK